MFVPGRRAAEAQAEISLITVTILHRHETGRVKRRRILVAAGGTLPVLLSGCLGSGQSDDSDGGSSPAASEPSTESNSQPGAGAFGTSAFDDESCPPFETDADRTVCSHTVDPDAAPVVLDASPVRTTLADGEPGEEITLTFYNRSGSEIEFNPDSWYVWQQTDGEWQELDQEWSGNGAATVAAGETHTWSFVEAVSAIQPDPQFDPGQYAAEIRVPDPAGDGQVACIALLELEAGE